MKKWTQLRRAAACLAVYMVLYQTTAVNAWTGERGTVKTNTSTASASDAEPPVLSASNALARSAATGNLWENWIGDLSFLDGNSGNGTREKPFRISSKEQLFGLSELAAWGMKVERGQGTYPGDYSGMYFELGRDIDLGGAAWMPIGFYQNTAELAGDVTHPFIGHFNGNGRTISNFYIYAPEWSNAGLFGAVKDSEIINLHVKPGKVITAKKTVGILAGRAENTVIRNVTVTGNLRTTGDAGGVAGELENGSIVENCTSDHVTIFAGTERETYVGGIAGKAADSVISDCAVNTGDQTAARINGGGYVGGIAGLQNSSRIYNTYVMGTIGGPGSQAIGGIVGKYASGKLKCARFQGTIGSSGLGSASHEGTFIGTRDTGFSFRYGVDGGADLAYLFTDSEAKLAAGVCGSGVPADNQYQFNDHVGFWHSGDNFYTLVQGGRLQIEDAKYFYEELEEGILHIIDIDEDAKESAYCPDHFAPNSVGRPTRGYLVSVLQVDTAANVQNYYDVAALTARGSSIYYHELDKEHRGAIAAGDLVTVMTAPKNTEEEKYQMDGVPTYTDERGRIKNTSYQKGGAYTFRMPEHDTEINAVYRKVAAGIKISPDTFLFQVTEERRGDRKNPLKTTEVRDGAGRLIARYINGLLENGTEVQNIEIGATVDKNDDVADNSVAWSVDDQEMLLLKRNDDEDTEGYTKKSASIELNLKAGYFEKIISDVERRQSENGYRYEIPDVIYQTAAVLTARTRPSASFEGKPVVSNCKIQVTFRIKDKTIPAAEHVKFNRPALAFEVRRVLTGDRKSPEIKMKVTEPQSLTAEITPVYFAGKEVVWETDGGSMIQIEAEDWNQKTSDTGKRDARISVRPEAKWIQDIISADSWTHEQDPYIRRTGKGQRTVAVRVLVEDLLGHKITAECPVTVTYVTDDQTEIMPEKIILDRTQIEYDLKYKKEGTISSKTVEKTGFDQMELKAEILPHLEKSGIYTPYHQEVLWISSEPSSLSVDNNGVIQPVKDAEWILKAMKKAPYKGQKTVTVSALSARNPKIKAECTVILNFETIYRPQSVSSSGGGAGSHVSPGSPSSGITVDGITRRIVKEPGDGITGIWIQDGAGKWLFTSGGRTFAGEWAHIYNPYAPDGQENPSWFRFNAEGQMITGWYQDENDGHWYYLNPETDGMQGKMETGWRWIAGKCFYFDDSGRLLVDTATPDGYDVNENGEWILNGYVQMK